MQTKWLFPPAGCPVAPGLPSRTFLASTRRMAIAFASLGASLVLEILCGQGAVLKTPAGHEPDSDRPVWSLPHGARGAHALSGWTTSVSPRDMMRRFGRGHASSRPWRGEVPGCRRFPGLAYVPGMVLADCVQRARSGSRAAHSPVSVVRTRSRGGCGEFASLHSYRNTAFRTSITTAGPGRERPWFSALRAGRAALTFIPSCRGGKRKPTSLS